MKYHLRIILIFLISSVSLYGQNKTQDSLRSEVAKLKTQNELLESRIDDFEKNQKTVLELKNELANANFNMANSKKEIYDSQINSLNLIFTVIGILIAILGVIGYRSISGRISDIKNEIEKDIEKLDKRASEIKTDINQKVNDIKSELKDFKKEQKEDYAKFEKSANEKIKEGLALQLQEAIDRIMKDSLGKQINNLNEQVADIFSTIEQIKTDNRQFDQSEEFPNDLNGDTVTGSKHTNAFEDEKQ
ncbi:MAG: hypothetical protein PHI42_08640 [Paludibacteraceae bacterium]|nr:hypothetical protein [Paludibacteraceae bacterium]